MLDKSEFYGRFKICKESAEEIFVFSLIIDFIGDFFSFIGIF